MRLNKLKFFGCISVFFFGILIFQAQMTLSGTVTDPDGYEVPNAYIEVVGHPEISTESDFDGNYSISIPESVAENGKVTLLVSTIDLADTNFDVDYAEGDVSQNFDITSSSKTLKTVVAVGYGTIDSDLATSSVAVVKSEDFNKGFVTNSDQLIRGKVPGVVITSSGTPQGGSNIRIRGGASLNASNDPLIVVDGLILDTGQGVSFLNPNDIESVSVLKDAAATAIYGNRGANGVIIYTTKKANKKKLGINYTLQFTANTLPYDYNNLSSGELQSIVNDTDWSAYPSLNNPQGLLGVASNPLDPTSPREYYDTDWMDLILNESMSMNQSISLTGGLFKQSLPVRYTMGYTGNNGILLTSKYERWSNALQLTPSFFNNSLRMTLNANATNERFNFADEGQISNAFTFDPTKPVKYDGLNFGNGYFEWTDAAGSAIGLAAANPYAALVQTHNIQKSRRLFGNLQFDYDLPWVKGMTLTVNGALDLDKWNGDNTKDAGARSSFFSPVSSTYVGNVESYNGYGQNKLLDLYMTYNKDIKSMNVEFVGGYAYQNFYRRSFNTGNQLDPTNVDPRTFYDPFRNYTNVGFFGRLNFNIKDRYLLYTNFRYDGTSRFGPDNQFEFFPGVSFGWVASNEKFLESSQFVNNLKFRFSYGKTGNQSLPSYQFLETYGTGTAQSAYNFGNDSYTALYPLYYNKSLKWETTNDFTVGMDYRIWSNRLFGSIEYYNRQTENLLAFVGIPPGSNFANQGFTNKGDLTSKGVDFSIGVNAIEKNDTNLSFTYNVGYNKKTIDNLGNGGSVNIGGINGLIGQTIQIQQEGFAPESYNVFRQVYDTSGRPIEGLFLDRDHNLIQNEDDKYLYKNPNPRFFMGFGMDFTYKRFNFAMNWRANIGNYVYNNLKANNTFLSGISGTQGAVSNITADYFSNGFIQKDVAKMQSDYFIENGSFLKMDNFTIGYTVSNFIKENASLNINFSGNNLFIITKSEVNDPEVTNGIYYNLYPRPRIFVLGFNFNY